MYKDKYIILEKLDGNFRQDLPIGNTEIQGWCKEEIEIGKPIFLYQILLGLETLTSWTSVIQEINDNIIKTQNSTYKIIIKEK